MYFAQPGVSPIVDDKDAQAAELNEDYRSDFWSTCGLDDTPPSLSSPSESTVHSDFLFVSQSGN